MRKYVRADWLLFIFATTFAFMAYADHEGPEPVVQPPPGGAAPAKVTFPCEIPAKGAPALRLVSFDGNPKDDEKHWKELLKKSLEGSIALSIEDYRGRKAADILKQYPEEQRKDARLFVHDDGLVKGLIDAQGWWVSYFRLSDLAKRLAAEKATLPDLIELNAQKQQVARSLNAIRIQAVQNLKNSDYRLEAWTEMKKSLKSDEAKALAAAIDGMLRNRDNDKEWTADMNRIQERKEWRTPAAWPELLKAWALAQGTLAKNKYAGPRRLGDLQPFFDLVDDPGSRDKENAFDEKIVGDVGVKQSAEAAAKVYCDNLKTGKPGDVNVVSNPVYFERFVQSLQLAAGGKIELKVRMGGHDFEWRKGVLTDVTPIEDRPVIDPSVPIEGPSAPPRKE